MEKRGLPYGGDDPNSWAAKESAPTYTRSHLEVDEKDWFDKKKAEGKDLAKPEDDKEEQPISPRSPSPEDHDLFDGDEKAREEFCKYAAKQMFNGKMGW